MSLFGILSLTLLSGILAYQLKDLGTAHQALSRSFDSLTKEHQNLLRSYLNLQGNYTALNESYGILNENYQQTQLKVSSLESQVSTLQNQLKTLQHSYQSLEAQYKTLQTECTAAQNDLTVYQILHIGTALETYCDYVRANSVTFGLEPMGEERWWTLSDYYDVSVEFAAALASHDIADCYWPELEADSGYQTYTGEYSYETSDRIMQKAMSLAGISPSDSNVMKIQKVLGFINSIIHYESKMLDHMWFPCETLAFRSGDCTAFGILAAAMLGKTGIKTATGFFSNETMGGHCMVLVHLEKLDPYGHYYYEDLTNYGLASGKWIEIEPQYVSLEEQQENMKTWFPHWSIVACAEVPYGP